MFKKIIPSCLLFISASVSAQPTLTGVNLNPVPGDAFQLKICDTTGITPGAGGASVTWNFATGANALVLTQTDTGQAVACTATPYYASFPSSTVALKGPTVMADATSYLIANSSRLAQNGYYAAPDTNLILSDEADQLRYPFTYMSSFTDTYSGMLTLGPIAAHHNGSISVLCDGWGTLQLPGRTDANVLRVKTTQVFVDSTNIFGAPLVQSYNILSYDWYKADYHTALLTIQTVTEVGATMHSFRFIAYAGAQISAVKDLSNNISDVSIAPNPAKGVCTLTMNLSERQQVRVSVTDVTGREVAVLADGEMGGKQQISYNIDMLLPGLYIVRIQAPGTNESRKLYVQ